MSAVMMVCPKCNGEMERGYNISRPNTLFAELWIKGTPKRAWFDFFRDFAVAPPKKTEDRLPVANFRCKCCGFLEFYARDGFQPQD